MVLRALGFALSFTLAVSIPLLWGGRLHSQTIPEPLTDTVSDYADVLDATAEARLQRMIEQTQEDTGVGIRVVTMSDTADYGGAGIRLDDYARALFDAWGLGQSDRKDSILMLVTTGPREARIVLGDDYDAVYDGRAARVLSSAVLPDLRQGQIGGAIEAGLFSIRDRLIVPFLAGQPIGLEDGFETGSGAIDGFAGYAAMAAIAGLAAVLLFRIRRNRRTCPKCGASTLTRSHEVIEPANGISAGTGLEHRFCTSCGFTDRRTYIPGRARPGRQDYGSGDGTAH